MKNDTTKDNEAIELEPLPGMEDRLGLKFDTLKYVNASLGQFFRSCGFQEIETSLIERVTTWSGNQLPEGKRIFTDVIFDLRQYSVKSELDSDNDVFTEIASILTQLRPEGTLPVCRYLAKEMNAGNNKGTLDVFYITPMFRNEPLANYNDVKRLMFYQAGVECMGPESIMADVEICSMAIEGLEQLGLEGRTVLRLNDIRLFEGLLELLEAEVVYEDASVKRLLKEVIDSISKYRAQGNKEKERGARAQLASVINGEYLSDQTERILDLVTTGIGSLEGLSETLDELRLLGNAKIAEAVDAIEELASVLDELGKDYLVDLAVVRGLDIYSGPVFQVDLRLDDGSVLEEVAGGGRYDTCVGDFFELVGLPRRDIPATGFAYGVERVVTALLETDSLPGQASVTYTLSESPADVLVWGLDPVEAMKAARELRQKGIRVKVDFLERSASERKSYAAESGMKLLIVGGDEE